MNGSFNIEATQTMEITEDAKQDNPSVESRRTLMDDSSEITEIVHNERVKTYNQVREFTIRFRFTPNNDTENRRVAKHHYELLKRIHENFKGILIYDNNGNTFNFKKQMKTYLEYASRFRLHYSKGNKAKKRHPQFSCYHRIRSAYSINDIRNHYEISVFMSKHKIKMNDHEWDETKNRIANIGFFTSTDPGNTLREEFETEIRTKIAKANALQLKNVPTFKCRYSSPFIYKNNCRIATKALNLEVPQEKAKEMIKLLTNTFRKDPIFIFHRIRHENQQVYINAIRTQNDFLAQCRVVPIIGVLRDLMFYLQRYIQQVPGVVKISLIFFKPSICKYLSNFYPY